MAQPALQRGCVFGAEHDTSYDFWVSADPRWKRCLAFNTTPPEATEEVHYFLSTSQVNFFREHPQFGAEVLIFPANAYPFFPAETAVDFRDLRAVPMAKLQSKGLRVLGQLSAHDIGRCLAIIMASRLLDNRAKRKLGLLS